MMAHPRYRIQRARFPKAKQIWTDDQSLGSAVRSVARRSQSGRAIVLSSAELIQAAAAQVAEFVAQLCREFVGAIVNSLRQRRMAERWGKLDLSAKHLAEHLFAAADGVAA